MDRKTLICHITTVHNAFDTRIFYKECMSLSAKFCTVSLIAPIDTDTEINGIKIIRIPQFKNRFLRISAGNFLTFLKAKKTGARIYHFHDPEFIIWAIFLKAFTRSKVIYDVHEDYYTAIKEKNWIKGNLFKNVIASSFNFLEKRFSRFFDAIVLAEDYYIGNFEGRNKNIIKVLNFPSIYESNTPINFEKTSFSIVYSGTVSETRGLWNILKTALHLMKKKNDFKIYIIGKFTSEALLIEALGFVRENNLNSNIEIIGGNEYIKREVIDSYYRFMDLGLFLPPFSKHYEKKMPTKFFEYMLAEIPFITTRFPEWEEFTKENSCGTTVNPDDFDEIINKIEYFIKYPNERVKMGKSGRENVLKKYNWSREAEKLEALYGELLKR